jgi:2-keto-3-deoxy-L-rhamnonate aldolase RhmA
VIRKAGKQCGILVTGEENLAQRRDQGFRFLGLGMDAGLLIRSLRAMLRAAGRDGGMTAALGR